MYICIKKYVHKRPHMFETGLFRFKIALPTTNIAPTARPRPIPSVLGAMLVSGRVGMLSNFRRCKSAGLSLEVAIEGRTYYVATGHRSISLYSLSYGWSRGHIYMYIYTGLNTQTNWHIQAEHDDLSETCRFPTACFFHVPFCTKQSCSSCQLLTWNLIPFTQSPNGPGPVSLRPMRLWWYSSHLEDEHGTQKWRFGKWFSFSIGWILGSIWIFLLYLGRTSFQPQLGRCNTWTIQWQSHVQPSYPWHYPMFHFRPHPTSQTTR